jgi:hypothetical protein
MRGEMTYLRGGRFGDGASAGGWLEGGTFVGGGYPVPVALVAPDDGGVSAGARIHATAAAIAITILSHGDLFAKRF